MTILKKVLNVYVSESYIMRDRGERNETFLFAKHALLKPDISHRFFFDAVADIDIFKDLMGYLPKIKVEEIVITQRTLMYEE
jgi:hypothetical protein